MLTHQCGYSVVDEQEQAAEQDLREAVAEAVEAMVKSLRHGEQSLCQGYVEAGRCAHQIVVAKLKLGDKRESAVRLVEEQLARCASVKVDANRLIKCWAAYDLLAVQSGLEQQAANTSYGMFRDGWALLVVRVEKSTPNEHYVLLPGAEDAAAALFLDSLANGMSKEKCVEQVRELVGKAKNRPVKQRTPKRTDAPPAGVNLIPARGASPKDVGDFLASCITANADPDLVLVELIGCLINAQTRAPIAAFHSEVVQDAIMAAVWAIQDAAAAEQDQDRREHVRRR